MPRPSDSNLFVIPWDPYELSKKTAAPVPEEELTPEQEAQEIQRQESRHIEYQRIKQFLSRIPKREQDIFELLFEHGKIQEEIADMFGLTQAAISYIVQRAIWRLRWLAQWPGVDLTPEQVRTDLTPVVGAERAEILASLLVTSCVSATGDELGLRQGRTRHAMLRAIDTLNEERKTNPNLEVYYETFRQVAETPLTLYANTASEHWTHRRRRLARED